MNFLWHYIFVNFTNSCFDTENNFRKTLPYHTFLFVLMVFLQKICNCLCKNELKLISGHVYNIWKFILLIGTGKSIVGAHLAYIFSINNKSKFVLYCCPSNKALDVVHSKFIRMNINFTAIL